MGTLTQDDLKGEIRAGIGNRTDLDSRLTRVLNLAQQRLARLHDFDEMEVTATASLDNTGSSNDRFLTLPAAPREIYSIIIEDDSRSRKLVQRSPRQWDKLLPMPHYHSRDIPHMYTLWGAIQAEVFPLPEKAYTNKVRLRYSKWPTAFGGSGTQTSDFLEKDELLVELSLSYIYRSLGKPDEALKHEAIARRLLSESDAIDRLKPDLDQVGDPRSGSESQPQEYWRDPFVRSLGGEE